jgi:hypothetical protein
MLLVNTVLALFIIVIDLVTLVRVQEDYEV